MTVNAFTDARFPEFRVLPPEQMFNLTRMYVSMSADCKNVESSLNNFTLVLSSIANLNVLSIATDSNLMQVLIA